MAIEAPQINQLETDPRTGAASDGARGLFAGRLALAVVGLGLLVVALGWYGISGDGALIDGKTDIRAQLPYLISGGFLGLSLVVLGSALLVTHSARLERARADALVEARFDSLVAALGLARLVGPADGEVVAGASAYHRPDCRLADGRQSYVSVEAAEELGLRACRICLG